MPVTPRPNYPYPVPNSELIATHSLGKHFEGGFFAQNVALESDSPKSPAPQNAHISQPDALGGRVQYASGPGAELLYGPPGDERVGEDKRLDATLIYYLLTPDSYRSAMHMNLHSVRTSVLLVDRSAWSIILTSNDFRLSTSITLGEHFTLSYNHLRRMVTSQQFVVWSWDPILLSERSLSFSYREVVGKLARFPKRTCYYSGGARITTWKRE